MNISQLITALQRIQTTFPTAVVRVQGWNDMGDLNDIQLRGDVRLERDAVGNPVVIIR
jgi:hypothetical protein